MWKTIQKNKRKIMVVALAALCLFALFAVCASAETVLQERNTNAPWEKAIIAFANSVKGPVAGGIAVLMFAACVWGVIRGAELSTWIAPTAIAALAVATLSNVDKILNFIGVNSSMLM